jgi:threonine dehydratase
MPDLDTLIVPIGGGGLISGISVAANQKKPGIRVIGVQAKGANSTFLAYHGQYEGPLQHIATIADGLATRAPGDYTLPIIKQYVDDVVTVEEDAIAQTVVMLMERAKVVAEGGVCAHGAEVAQAAGSLTRIVGAWRYLPSASPRRRRLERLPHRRRDLPTASRPRTPEALTRGADRVHPRRT